MLNDTISSIITYSKEMHQFCEGWKNAAMGAQYCIPIKTINRYLSSKQNLSVLDWGCGDGHFSYLLGMNPFLVHSYSFYELGPMQQVIENKLKNRFVFDKSKTCHPIQLPYADETFDAVFSVGVLEHVREFGGDEIASLREIHRILKPGGYCFIFHLPNKYSWIERYHRVLKRLKLVNKYIHNHLYHKPMIHEMARASDFSVVSMSLYNLFPRNFFKFMPNAICNNRLFVSFITFLEKTFSLLFYNFSQNYCIVMQKQIKEQKTQR